LPTRITDEFGSGLIIAKGAAASIIILTVIVMLTICRDMLTWLRSTKCANCFTTLLDEHITVHKVCGILIFFYSVLHTIGHLYGTFYVLSTNTLDTDNSYLHTHLDSTNYMYLLFETIPGLSGVILLIIVTLMSVTSH